MKNKILNYLLAVVLRTAGTIIIFMFLKNVVNHNTNGEMILLLIACLITLLGAEPLISIKLLPKKKEKVGLKDEK